MSKIVWDIREMNELAAAVRQQSRQLLGVHEALTRDQRVDALVSLLNDIEREAEARSGRIMADLPPALAQRVETARRALLASQRLPFLIDLHSMVDSLPPGTALRNAGTVRD